MPRVHARRARRGARRQAGFTLVELMVALVIGALVVAAMFTIGGASARHFQEQQRVGVTQRSVRHAMDRIRGDLQRAGYGHVPHHQAPGVNTCPAPAIPMPVPAVWFDDSDSAGNTALAAVNRSQNNTSADRLRLIGNYNSGDSFLVSSIDNSGDTVFLQTDWLAFRRTFVTRNTDGTFSNDRTRFENVVFRAGSMVRIFVPQTGRNFFVRVTSATFDGGLAQIDIAPSISLDSECMTGYGGQAILTPLAWIEYAIVPAAAGTSLLPNQAAVTGANTLLVRRELDMSDSTGNTVIPGTQRTVLEYAIDFNMQWVIDQNAPTGVPDLVTLAGPAAEGVVQATPWRARSAILRVAARTPEQDARFPWPDGWASGRPTTAPLNRYRVFSDRPGAARVRSLVTEVQLPNLIL